MPPKSRSLYQMRLATFYQHPTLAGLGYLYYHDPGLDTTAAERNMSVQDLRIAVMTALMNRYPGEIFQILVNSGKDALGREDELTRHPDDNAG